MSILIVSDRKKLDFISDLLQISTTNPFNLTQSEGGLNIDNQALAKILERYVQGKATVLPFWRVSDKCVLWIVWGADRRELLKTTEEVRSFLTPVWAEIYYRGEEVLDLPSGWAENFTFGLQLFRSPVSLFDKALVLLGHWANLCEMRPMVTVDEGKINVHMLRSQFQEAIDLHNWDAATQLLGIIRKGHYLSDENHLFFKIQILSAQQRWTELWNDDNYELASGLDPLPAKVRNALLTAFYMAILAPCGEDLAGALVVFKANRYRLGTLLRYRAGVDETLPLVVFGYEAVMNKDKVKLDKIMRDITSKESLVVLQKLRLFAGEKPIWEIHEIHQGYQIPGQDFLKVAKVAFGEGLFDEAYLHVLDCEPGLERVRLMLRLAKITEDVHICARVRDEYSLLVKADKDKIMASNVDRNSVMWVLNYEANVARTFDGNKTFQHQ